MTLSQAEIDFNRQEVVHRLRANPAGHKQVKGILSDGKKGYCAIGEMAEALHLSPKIHTDSTVYSKVASMVGEASVSFVHIDNDSGSTFKEIAQELADRWGLN